MIVSLTATSLKSKASLAESTSRRTLGHTLCKARFHAHFNEAVLLLAISHLIPGSWRGDLAHQRKKKKTQKQSAELMVLLTSCCAGGSSTGPVHPRIAQKTACHIAQKAVCEDPPS